MNSCINVSSNIVICHNGNSVSTQILNRINNFGTIIDFFLQWNLPTYSYDLVIHLRSVVFKMYLQVK